MVSALRAGPGDSLYFRELNRGIAVNEGRKKKSGCAAATTCFESRWTASVIHINVQVQLRFESGSFFFQMVNY
jgi:hypothetical protein